MSPTKKITLAAASVAICLALTACSGAPSESDLKSAIETKMKADSKAMESAIGKQGMPVQPEIKGVHKVGCKGDGENAYRCDIELEVMQNGTVAKGAASMRFSKNGDAWSASK